MWTKCYCGLAAIDSSSALMAVLQHEWDLFTPTQSSVIGITSCQIVYVATPHYNCKSLLQSETKAGIWWSDLFSGLWGCGLTELDCQLPVSPVGFVAPCTEGRLTHFWFVHSLVTPSLHGSATFTLSTVSLCEGPLKDRLWTLTTSSSELFRTLVWGSSCVSTAF